MRLIQQAVRLLGLESHPGSHRAYAMVLVRLSLVEPEVLRKLLEDAWRQSAAKRVLAAYDRDRG